MSKPEYRTAEDEITFNILNENVVKRLQKQGEVKLPQKKVDVPRDMRWNLKTLNSMLLQGIQNGDSVKKIAASIFPEVNAHGGIVAKNQQSAIRNARTMTTEAENKGRLDSYDNLADQGVVQKKVWIATPDDRTRESHLEIDGEEVDIDEPFSNGLMYPADPDGDPAEVWNCRCSMRTHIVGVRKADGHVEPIGTEREQTMHNEQIAEERERRGVEPEEETKETFTFTPAETKEEAARFIEQYVDSTKFGATGVDYTGIDLAVQNEVNETLAELQETYNVPKFGGIVAPAGNTREGKAISGATAAYSPVRDSFYLNRSSLKTMAVADKELRQSAEAVKDIYLHPEKYDLTRMSRMAQRVIENGWESGRTTVPESIKEVIWHEYGHRLEKFIPKDEMAAIHERMSDFASKISGYACESTSEYIAESFCCFNNGEKNIIDPVLADVFEKMKK